MTGPRRTAVLALAAAWLVLTAAPAAADPPGPTDYETEVVAIDPPTGGFRVEVVGGDSFIVIEADPGVTLEVIGYRGEPYLVFHPDGRVEENRASPTTYLNIDRYAEADIPPAATPDAAPEWVVVATDGTYAWHDHRAHWMNRARPPGAGPGEVILAGVVPLVVDGVEVDVAVVSTWQPSPPAAVPVAGMAAGALLAAAAALGRARLRALAGLLLALAAPAAALGLVALFSVPPETAPPWSLWAPPVAAAVLAVAAFAGREGSGWPVPAALICALTLLVWAVLHQEWMWRAVLPTSAPFWLDRLVTGVVLVGAPGLLLLIGRAQLRRAAG